DRVSVDRAIKSNRRARGPGEDVFAEHLLRADLVADLEARLFRAAAQAALRRARRLGPGDIEEDAPVKRGMGKRGSEGDLNPALGGGGEGQGGEQQEQALHRPTEYRRIAS